jgi:cardiolipin synthase A/B
MKRIAFTRKRTAAFALGFILILLLAGCASLPDFKEMDRDPGIGQKTPQIVGSRGELPAPASKAILNRLKNESGSAEILQRQISLLETISGNPLVAGNQVTLLVDGPATYAAMFHAIRNARDHVHFETYIFEGDEIGNKFADLLLKKQAEGVQVRLIYDSVGSMNTPADFFKRLRDGGVQVVEFNPVNPFKVKSQWLLNNRDHRKMLIVDGEVAFTGGVNISQVYTSRPSGSSGMPSGMPSAKAGLPEAWRDTHVRIEGPAVAEFQKLFLETWRREKGPEPARGNYFPRVKPKGNDLVEVVGSTPELKTATTYLMYLSAFTHAEISIHLTTAYFVPDKKTLEALTAAARRGVDVQIILPGFSDLKMVFYAGRSYYQTLLDSGVKLYETRQAVLHAKTAVIDGVWSTVGSTNMDLWSYMNNDEVNAVILGAGFAAKMEEMFGRDLDAATPILVQNWKERPFSERLREFFARRFAFWL